MNTCRNCGARLVDGACYCGICGSRAHFEKKPADGSRVALIIVGSFLGAGLLMGALIVFSIFALVLIGHSNRNLRAANDASSCNQATTSMIPEPSGKPQFVYFYDESCPSCQQLQPIVDELSQAYSGKIDFILIDSTTPEGDCEFWQQGFDYVPAMMFIDSDGYILDMVEGSPTRKELQQELDELLDFPGPSIEA